MEFLLNEQVFLECPDRPDLSLISFETRETGTKIVIVIKLIINYQRNTSIAYC